jgi:hypothetical protein
VAGAFLSLKNCRSVVQSLVLPHVPRVVGAVVAFIALFPVLIPHLALEVTLGRSSPVLCTTSRVLKLARTCAIRWVVLLVAVGGSRSRPLASCGTPRVRRIGFLPFRRPRRHLERGGFVLGHVLKRPLGLPVDTNLVLLHSPHVVSAVRAHVALKLVEMVLLAFEAALHSTSHFIDAASRRKGTGVAA